MKTFVCVLFFVALVVAEPPRFRQTFRFGRQEAEEGNSESAKPESEDAPYPASGFRPTKEFNLPSRQELTPPSTTYGVPDSSYGAPLNTYTAPQTEYGIPNSEGEDSEEEKKEGENDSETVESADRNRNSEEGRKEKSEKKEKENLEESPKDDVINGQGAYYVLLPGSQLQRVQFQTKNDLTNMAYTARLQYKNEDRAPIYLYTVPQYQSGTAAAYFQAPSAAYYQPSAAYYQW